MELFNNNDESGTELLLMAVDDNDEFGFMTLSDDTNFTSDSSILKDPNFFIADNGATSDTTPFLYGLKIFKEESKEDAITDESRTNISARKRGNLKGVMCDNHGKYLHDVSIGGVVHMPQSEFNLFIISTIMKEIWTSIDKYYLESHSYSKSVVTENCAKM